MARIRCWSLGLAATNQGQIPAFVPELFLTPSEDSTDCYRVYTVTSGYRYVTSDTVPFSIGTAAVMIRAYTGTGTIDPRYASILIYWLLLLVEKIGWTTCDRARTLAICSEALVELV